MNDPKTHPPEILDCTLRDGSYAINFAFTASDTRALCAGLESVGIRWIEVGHGVGLGASASGFGMAQATDGEYMAAASESLSIAKWGMFCIPKVARLEMLAEAASHGMGFVRIGANIEEHASVRPFVERAKELGLFTCVNFMKSYASPPEDFARYAEIVDSWGTDLIYLVDSAGGMLPEQVAAYTDAVRSRAPNLRIGFHGHHNLGLGVANSLVAVERGAEFIDVSLQGMGRSAGNTPAEQFVCALMRRGIDLDIDPTALMDLSESLVVPRHAHRGIDSFDVISGLAQFHSSYMGVVARAARRHDIDPRRLIVRLCEHDKVDAPEALVESLAAGLAAEGLSGGWKALYKNYYGQEQR